MMSASRLTQLFKENKRRGEEIFPELIKRLVIGSANSNYTDLRFPEGDSITAPGFDGYITGVVCHDEFLPEGDSIFELGTGGNYKTKIKDDFNKRTSGETSFDKSDYTFILCTSNVFAGDLLSFQTELDTNNTWKDVRVYDAEIISQWLNKHFEVILWLYEKFDYKDTSLDVSRADNYFSSYLDLTEPKMTKDIILCSQSNEEGDQIKKFKEKISSEKSAEHILFSPISVEHGILFSLAVINEEQALLEKTLVVKNLESLKFIEKEFSNKIVIINFRLDIDNLHLTKNKYIYSVNDKGMPSHQKLNSVRFNDFHDNLIQMGFDKGEAYNITQKTNRNISCLKRMLAKDLSKKIPSWAKNNERDVLIPLALVSEFDKRYGGDIALVNKLHNNADYISKLENTRFSNESPVFNFGDIYQINYKEEVLFTLDLERGNSYIEKLEKIFRNIMLDTNRSCEPNNVENQFLKGNNKCSRNLINGIIETFIILAVKDPGTQAYYDIYIESMLLNSLDDITTLNAVTSYLPLIAELSPRAVLNFINIAIDRDNNSFRELIENENNAPILNGSKFYNYKFAIDKCLYNDDTSIEALRLVFKLYNSNYKFPKNFNIKDYAISSFGPVSYPTIPVKPSVKYRILTFLINDNNKEKSFHIFEAFSNWEFAIFEVSNPVFKYRENSKTNEITRSEIFDLAHDAIIYLIENTNDKLKLFVNLIDRFHIYYERTINYIFDKIAEEVEINDDIFKSEINYMLLDKIHNIQRFADESENNHWLYQHKYLDNLIELYDKSAPTNLFFKYRYLFVNYFDDVSYMYPEPFKDLTMSTGWAEKEFEIKSNIYLKAFTELFEKETKDISIRIINEMKDDYYIGLFLSKKSQEKLTDIKQLIFLKKNDGLRGYISIMGVGQLKELFSGLASAEKLVLIGCLDLNERNYSIIKDTEYEEIYWKSFKRFQNHNDKDFEQLAIEKFLEFNPLPLVDHYLYSGSNIAYENQLILLEALNNKEIITNINQLKAYKINLLVKRLDSVYYDERLVSAELGLLPFFLSSNYDYPGGVKRFFLANPLSLYRLFKSCCESEDTKDNTVAKVILLDCILLNNNRTLVSTELIVKDLKDKYNDEVNKKESLLEKWFNSILNELNLEENEKVLSIITNFLIHILSLSFSYDKNNKYDYVIARLLETLGENKGWEDRYKISETFCVSKLNSQGPRMINDGSVEKKKADDFLTLSEIYKIEYPILSSALKMLSEISLI